MLSKEEDIDYIPTTTSHDNFIPNIDVSSIAWDPSDFGLNYRGYNSNEFPNG
jgi:hypothetical protein